MSSWQNNAADLILPKIRMRDSKLTNLLNENYFTFLAYCNLLIE